MTRSPQSGFTLVELLLAVTLMSMLLGLAYGGLRAATRASDNGQQQLEDTLKMRVTHQFVRRQINQMQPLTFDILGDTPQDRVIFEGEANRIRFVAPMPGYLGQGGPQVQTLEAVNGPDGIDLVFNHELLQAYDPAVGETGDPIFLMEGLESVQFSFLARDEQGELIGWTPSWVTPDLLPAAVSLEITPREGSVVSWPLLTAAVRIDPLATTASGAAETYSDVIKNMIQNPGEQRR
ncbi:MAG: prepilin-type N-terminal cleavage/methylation domain-containing protein [Xanthomonadales bacterium]|nr:prepilin-type N-terminal cleavage/methylation domain-containing protein [Gammaproteobacteria bacterium]NNE04128.1 prepilin-type N-terminal cleavage/methylation domain-containing protein [Xanthomonadales bacterium]NNL94974.1 prepilin-type N-terminal cleavage/methylation domain-containing protein [Xanthomonadales bacterium]